MINLPQGGRQVLGAELNRSESRWALPTPGPSRPPPAFLILQGVSQNSWNRQPAIKTAALPSLGCGGDDA
jgi:hypothetical protein